GLAQSPIAQGTEELLHYLSEAEDASIVATACLAVANPGAPTISRTDAAVVSKLARSADDNSLRRACAFAEAVQLPDGELARMQSQLWSSDPVFAAIAAWRLGQAAEPSSAHLEALYRRVLGPHGLPRDAAI